MEVRRIFVPGAGLGGLRGPYKLGVPQHVVTSIWVRTRRVF